MNPYPKPGPGAYRDALVAGLLQINQPQMAEAFKAQKIHLGVVASFTGSVKTKMEWIPFCISALQAVPQTDLTRYYLYQLEHKLAVPALAAGAYVYDPNDQSAVAYVQQRVEQDNQRVYAPGELFFKAGS